MLKKERTVVDDTLVGLVTFMLGYATLCFLTRRQQKTPLYFEDLESLCTGPVEVMEHPQRPKGTEVSVKFRCGPACVFYDRYPSNGKRIETLDISAWKKIGFILTFENDEIITFKRAGSEPMHNPEIAARHYNLAHDFLVRVREIANLVTFLTELERTDAVWDAASVAGR